MTERIGQKFGNYRLTRFLGKGGFASVYLAEHIHLQTEAAIKVLAAQLSNQEVEQFRQEAYVLARFNHPNIIRMLDFGLDEAEHLPFLVMQYAAHGTLRQRHAADSCVSLSLVRFYVKSIAAALQYAHDRRIIHRDVKPENMLIDDQEEILLSDFGLALLSQNTLDSLQQQAQDMGGTASYMAPEQFQGKARPASDQYALAVVVYEWLCGVRPFEGNFVEVCAQHMAVEPQPLRQKLPTLSAGVERVVMKALEKDPKQRFDSIQAFAAAFEEAAEEKTTASDIESVPTAVLLEHMMASSEHVEEQEKVVANHQSKPPQLESLHSSPPLQDERAVAQLASPTPITRSNSEIGLQGERAVSQLAPDRRQDRKPRPWLIGVAALTLLSVLAGGTAFAVLTLAPNTHNATNATTSSKATAHPPAAKATATPTATTQPPAATPTIPPVTTTQPPAAPAPAPVIASADFTTQVPGLNNMTLVANDSFFSGNGYSTLDVNQQVVVAFTLQPNVNTVTLFLTGLVSQNGSNVTGFSPINIYCNGQAVTLNFTMPGNGGTGIGPSTASFTLSMQQLFQGSNQVQLVVASNALTLFWLYNLTVKQSF
jgi:serine/threonine protein kinase